MWKQDRTTGYWIYKQQHLQSCGLACTAMAARQLDKCGSIKESTILQMMPADARKAYNSATVDRVAGARPSVLTHIAAQRGDIHWGSGTVRSWVEHALNRYGVRTSTRGGRKSAIRSASPTTPVIVGVRWTGGGGHWVMVVDRSTRGLGKKSDYTILDPAGNVVVNRGSTSYTAANGAKGTFADDFIKCST